MNSSIVKIVEIKCRHNSFSASAEDLAEDVRNLLRSYPSNIIQTRITFDALCNINLNDLQPLALQRLQNLKSEMIDILQDDDHNTCSLKDL